MRKWLNIVLNFTPWVQIVFMLIFFRNIDFKSLCSFFPTFQTISKKDMKKDFFLYISFDHFCKSGSASKLYFKSSLGSWQKRPYLFTFLNKYIEKNASKQKESWFFYNSCKPKLISWIDLLFFILNVEIILVNRHILAKLQFMNRYSFKIW